MKIASCCCLLLVAAATVVMVTGTKINFEEYGTEEERAAVIQEAIVEAKEAAKYKEEATKAAAAQAERDGKYTSSQLLSKFFKRPSETAKKMGKAQLLYEAMVRKAERKLAEKHRQSHAASQSSKERAQELANEIFHRPGSMLTAQEIAHMWTASECIDARPVPSCNFATVSEFRTIDGTCNNLANPLFGAATTPFTRLVPAFYEDGISSLRGTLQATAWGNPFAGPNPSPRSVSDAIVDNDPVDEMQFTHMLMQWGQFLDHDLDLAPELEEECEHCEFTEICIPIRVENDDPDFGVGTDQDAECLSFRRSLPACDESVPNDFNPRELINDITSFIDGSMVYGSNDDIASAVRDTSDGLLLTGHNGRSLPIDTEGLVACPNLHNCFLCGDVRCNEQISLTIMHTIWVREHNRIATALKALNPHWDDERLYQEARSIVGALIQKITYVDFLPKLLGTTGFTTFIGPYLGYDPTVNAGVPNSFAAAAYRFGHSLIRPEFARLNSGFTPLMPPLGLVDAFFDPSQFVTSGGTDPILRGLVSEDARRLDEFLNDVLTSQLFQTSTSPGMDLASLNIQRGRDHGLPPHLIYQNFCNTTFGMTSMFGNSVTLSQFLLVYGSLDTADLWIAGLAEGRLPGALLGATFSCIFGITFASARSGDRFWYENPGVFTPSQVTALNSDSLSRVICDNADDIDMIQPDAFRSDQTRISCDDIPGVDLSLWLEESCFFRVRVRPRRYRVRISAFSRVNSTRPFVFTQTRVHRSYSRQFACVPTLCPTSTDPLDLIVFSLAQFQSSLVITADSDLPDDRIPLSGVYRADIARSFFYSQADGFFTSEQACDDSSSFAFDFRFPTRNNVEAELLALVEDADEQEENNDQVDLPDGILEIITNDGGRSQAAPATGNDEGHVVAEVSDESLMQELEKALEEMKN